MFNSKIKSLALILAGFTVGFQLSACGPLSLGGQNNETAKGSKSLSQSSSQGVAVKPGPRVEVQPVVKEGYYLSATSLQSKVVLVEELNSGKVLYSKNKGESFLPASVEKLFTIDYALTLCQAEDSITVTPEVLKMIKPESSLANLVPGTYKVKDIVAGLLVPSGNDAAYSLANHCGIKLAGKDQGAITNVAVFMANLQQYLKKEGYLGTHMTDPSGYAESDLSTTVDVAKVSRKILAQKWLADIVKVPTYLVTFPNKLSYKWDNSNRLLHTESAYHIPGSRGLKTGSLFDSYNLVSIITIKGVDYLILTFGSPTSHGRYMDIKAISQAIGQGL